MRTPLEARPGLVPPPHIVPLSRHVFFHRYPITDILIEAEPDPEMKSKLRLHQTDDNNLYDARALFSKTVALLEDPMGTPSGDNDAKLANAAGNHLTTCKSIAQKSNSQLDERYQDNKYHNPAKILI